MATLEQCMNCTEPCPQAEAAHEIAKGRMYATNELINLVKKMESGQLVEVVRCKDCKHTVKTLDYFGKGTFCTMWGRDFQRVQPDKDFCSYGERREENAAD